MSGYTDKSAESMDVHFARLEQTTTTLQDERAAQVRAALASAKEIENRLQLPVAKLLLEVKLERYWAHWGFASFQDFVETDCRFSVRKAQELMRVYTKLVVELEITPERIAHLGWSKVALCAAKLTPANVEASLKEIEEKSFGELRAACKKTPNHKQASKINREGWLSVTPVIQAAIDLAADATGCSDPQTNLEFVARRFHAGVPEFAALSRPGLN